MRAKKLKNPVSTDSEHGDLVRQGWYEQYPKLSSAMFTYENSGNKANLSPPGRRSIGGDSIKLHFSTWTILGYTLNPPFAPSYEAVAIMFEYPDFNKIWWHFLKDNDADKPAGG